MTALSLPERRKILSAESVFRFERRPLSIPDPPRPPRYGLAVMLAIMVVGGVVLLIGKVW